MNDQGETIFLVPTSPLLKHLSLEQMIKNDYKTIPLPQINSEVIEMSDEFNSNDRYLVNYDLIKMSEM